MRVALPTGLAETIRALPQINRRLTVAVGATTIVVGLAPVGYIIATKILIDHLAGSTHAVPAFAVAFVCGFFALTEVLTPFFHAMAETFGYWINRALRIRLMRASIGPKGVSHIEDEGVQDVLSRAVRIGSSGLTPGAAIAGLAIIGKVYVQGVGCAVLMSTFIWWLGPILLLAAVLVSFLILRDFSNATRVLTGESPVLRRANYFRGVMTDPHLAGELRLLFLGDWVLDRFRRHWMSAMQGTWKARRPRVSPLVVGTLAVTAVVAGATALMSDSVQHGSTSLGTFVLLAQALLGFLPMFAVNLRHLNVTNGAAVMEELLAFESDARCSGSSERATTRPAERGTLVFDGVNFAYNPGARPVFESVSFEVPFGSSVAIVGLNGVGKTTLIKLLARLYEPNEGQIVWDGQDIRSLDVDLWRQKLAVLFQDFLRLPFTATDNVRCGALHAPFDHAVLNRAAIEGNATSVVEALPDGWETRLARGYRGGTDLSGGQWQRIAAARAFYAVDQGAQVLVLDEPSSALDIRAEAQFFARFHDLSDVTRILISHRLAAVRHADRIVLLDGGTVREQGSHDVLMAKSGVYAALFRSQMERSVL